MKATRIKLMVAHDLVEQHKRVAKRPITLPVLKLPKRIKILLARIRNGEEVWS